MIAMLKPSSPIDVSSMNSIIHSIDNDRQVYRWFLILISIPEIKQGLSSNDKVKEKYRTLQKTQVAELFTYIVTALMIFISCLIKQPWGFLFWAGPLVILINLFRKNRKCVAAISEQFLLEKIPTHELKKQSLYQICEHFSRAFNIPSLVDIITFQDFISRKVLLGSIFLLPFISRFKTWQIWAVTCAVLLTTLAIVNTSIVLRRLK